MAKPANGFEYWELLLVYVDYILIVSHIPKPILEQLSVMYEVEVIGPPQIYLGANIGKYTIPGDPSGKEYNLMEDNFIGANLLAAEFVHERPSLQPKGYCH